MSPENESFNDLRRLLALKRHEVPPPGYFNGFSGQVISRIRAGDRPESSFRERLWESPWLQQLWGMVEAKPILGGVFAAGVSALLLASMILSEGAPAGSAVAQSPSDASVMLQAVQSSPLSSVDGTVAQAAEAQFAGVAQTQVPAAAPLSTGSQLPGGSMFDELSKLPPPIDVRAVSFPARH
jgi:hypothetical protein